jgi:hypothetical protein
VKKSSLSKLERTEIQRIFDEQKRKTKGTQEGSIQPWNEKENQIEQAATNKQLL